MFDSHDQSGGRRDNRFHPYKRSDRQSQEQESGKPAWKQLGCFSKEKRWSTVEQVFLMSGQGSAVL